MNVKNFVNNWTCLSKIVTVAYSTIFGLNDIVFKRMLSQPQGTFPSYWIVHTMSWLVTFVWTYWIVHTMSKLNKQEQQLSAAAKAGCCWKLLFLFYLILPVYFWPSAVRHASSGSGLAAGLVVYRIVSISPATPPKSADWVSIAAVTWLEILGQVGWCGLLKGCHLRSLTI